MNVGDDFPECTTAAAVIDELTRILSGWETFTNGELRNIAAAIESDMQNHPGDFAVNGIENAVHHRALPYKNRLFLLLELDDRHRFPFDKYPRFPECLIWAIGLTRRDFEHWERSIILTSSREISEGEAKIALAILTLHQRLADIRNEPARVAAYDRDNGGPGPGDGGGGARVNLQSARASLPRDFAPMRAMLLRL